MYILTVSKRDLSKKTKNLRRSGIIPGNIFGNSLSNSISIQMDISDARNLIKTNRIGSKLKLKIDEQIIPVQLKDKTFNTLNNEILHIDFQALNPNQKVNSVIHIILKNTDKISNSLEKLLMEIPYASLPDDMIDTITIDMDGKTAGSIITVGDIEELKNENIELQVNTDDIILKVNDRKNYFP